MSLPENAPGALQTAVVPAAGWGTRLRPLSDTLPKELLPLGRRTVLEHVFLELIAAGLTRIVLVVSPAKEALMKSRFGKSFEGACIEYALQPEMRGLGDAVRCARPHLLGESQLVVALGDAVFVEEEPGRVLRRLLARGEPLAIAVQRVARERLSRYGVVRPVGAVSGEGFAIEGIVEKPAPEDAPSEWAVAARYRLPVAVFDALRDSGLEPGGEKNLTGAIAALLTAGVPGAAVPLLPGEARHDIGGFETYWCAFAAFALADPEYGPSLRGYLKEVV